MVHVGVLVVDPVSIWRRVDPFPALQIVTQLAVVEGLPLQTDRGEKVRKTRTLNRGIVMSFSFVENFAPFLIVASLPEAYRRGPVAGIFMQKAGNRQKNQESPL
jgi:hypothetical protein